MEFIEDDKIAQLEADIKYAKGEIERYEGLIRVGLE